MEDSNISPQAISLAGLSVEFCKVLAQPHEYEPQAFVRECLRYIPRIYIGIADVKPYIGDDGESYDEYGAEAIMDSVNEEQYDMVREGIATVLGEYDVYLDTPVQDMRFSDTPVGVSLAEQLADIFQALGNFAATVGAADSEALPDILADLKSRFRNYLSETLCSALRAANMLYQSQALLNE